MSKNNDKRPSKTEYIRSQSLRLPTPPPDPNSNSSTDGISCTTTASAEKESDFMDYLNSLPTQQQKTQGESTSQQAQSNEKLLQRTGSLFTPIVATEDAFDHLDKLYKLMEQLLNLREQNAKLQRRVRDLEHLRNLQNMDEIVTNKVLRGEDTDVPELDDDTMLAEAFLDNMLNKGGSKRRKPTQFRLQQSILRHPRDRSSSVLGIDPSMQSQGVDPSLSNNSNNNGRPRRDLIRKASKVSKWTKVKAAFKWEKASPTVSGAKSQDSGIGGMIPVNSEVARYLRVPSTCDNPNEQGASPADSVLSGSWNAVHGLSTPGTLSSASSADDLHQVTRTDHRSVSRTGSAGNANTSNQFRRSKTSDEEDGERRSRSLDYTGPYTCEGNTVLSKDDLIKLHSSKSHKTPWGKVKDIIQTRKDSMKKKQHRLSAKSDDFRITDYSAGSDQEDVFEAPSGQDPPMVTVTKSELSESHLYRIPPEIVARYRRVAAEEDKIQSKSSNGSPRVQRRVSKWTKVKKAFLTSTNINRNDDSQSVPSSPIRKTYNFFSESTLSNWKSLDAEDKNQSFKKMFENDMECRKLKEEIHKNYEQLQKKLSQEFEEKLHEWEKVKSSSSTAPSIGSTQLSSTVASSEDQRDPEFVKKMEEWEKIKNQTSTESKKKNIPLTSEENLPADFRKKLQEWQKMKKFGPSGVATAKENKEEDASTSRKKKLEWQLWRSNSSNKPDAGLQLSSQSDRQYSEDFLKKLDEWKQIKASHSSGNNEDMQENRKSFKEPKTSSPNLSRKSSNPKLVHQNKNHKMQEWLEKELQKIEREKQRLEREREKFLEREERLAKLRRSIGNGPHKKDVLVQTSTGFFRFEGISRKFTQRLYEWEKARGIAPEASTFNFLNSGFHQILPNTSNNTNHEASCKREQMPRIKLTRSKSMDSVANLTCGAPLITHQPSSLSLNDVDELEMQCLAETQSEKNLNKSEDNLDYEEPEAVIVEVEDFVEETAAPLEVEPVHGDNHYTPVYQTQMLKLCESEKCEAPQVRRSESARALSNYNLIQESLNILNTMRENEISCKTTEAKLNEQEQVRAKNTGAIPKRQKGSVPSQSAHEPLQTNLNKLYTQQAEMSLALANKILQLQDANMTVAKNVTNENTGYTISHLSDALNLTEDLSTELVSIAEKLKIVLLERKSEFHSVQKEISSQANNKYAQDIREMIDLLIQKIKELKRSLSYLCAASDMTAPGRNKKGSYKKRETKQRSSLEQISSTNDNANNDTSDEEDEKKEIQKHPRRKEKLFKSKSEDNHIVNYAKLQVTCYADQRKESTKCFYQLNKTSKSQAHLNFQSLDNQKLEEMDCVNVEGLKKKGYQKKKLVRSRRISDSCSNESNKIEEKCENSTSVETFEETSNVIIPTQTQYLDATANTTIPSSNYNSANVSVFVHTTRKVFCPIHEENVEPKKKESPSRTVKILRRSHSPADSPMLPRKKRLTITTDPDTTKQDSVERETQQTPSRPSTPSHLPPLPNSPIFQRRERHLSKETSPAIRLMIARYNQKLSEQDAPGTRSGGSSGSASPVAWRSPVFERRVKAQTEKYQEEVNKTLTNSSGYSPLFMRKQLVKKSASIGVISSSNSQITSPELLTINRGSSLGSSEATASPKLIRGILKSTSVGSLKTNTSIPETLEQQCEVVVEETSGKQLEEGKALKSTMSTTHSSENSPILKERAHKLQKAKEEFLSQKMGDPSTSSSASQKNEKEFHIHYPTRNRLSQVSFGSESSCDDLKYSGTLIKSASAGMINVDEETYEQFKPEIHTQGYVSLPRAAKKKDGKFGISSIASKFRKVKMRRSKDHNQMNTVSTLCRQSLIVDITDTDDAQPKTEEEKKNKKKTSQESSTSDIHSASTSSTTKSSWIKIFKPKDTNK